MILDSAESLESLAGLPTNRFEALKGDLKGQFSIRINDQLVVLSLMKYKSKLSQTRQVRDPSGGKGGSNKAGLTSDPNSSITESPHPGAAQASKTLKSLEPRA